MSVLKIAEDIYSVGVVDWGIRHFHGYTYETKSGTSYNSYLIFDKEIAVVDTVSAHFADEFINNIKSLVEPSKIKYIIANHGEPDHSGTIPELAKLAPQAKIVCSGPGKESLTRQLGSNFDFQVVKTGDKISLGKKTLVFIEARMLHWPDSMYTYAADDEILFSNDSFGQHLASYYRFEDELEKAFVMDEAQKYYANIITPFSQFVLDVLSALKKMNIGIRTIAPAHGVIWRKEPKRIMDAYRRWANGEAFDKVVIIYETMYGATEKMARAIYKGIEEEGVEAILYNAPVSDRSDMIKNILDAKGLLVGSSTHNGGPLLNVAALLEDVKGLKFKNKRAAAFGAHGWVGKGVEEIEKSLAEGGFEVVKANLAVKFAADEGEIKRCVEFGKDFARQLRGEKIHA